MVACYNRWDTKLNSSFPHIIAKDFADKCNCKILFQPTAKNEVDIRITKADYS